MVTRTGAQLLDRFSQFIGDYFSSTTTGAGQADGSTLVDSRMEQHGADALVDRWFRLTSGDAAWEVQRASGNSTSGVVTLAPGFGSQVASGVTYDRHAYDPRIKFRSLNRGRVLAFPQVSLVIVDETLTGDGISSELAIPGTIARGPVDVLEESILSPSIGWNALTSPELKGTTSAWAATSLTVSQYDRINQDLIVPKVEASCVKLVGSGVYAQVVANMNGITAAGVAGRRVTFACWVFARESGSSVQIVEDADTATSSIHTGQGWQFLSISHDIPDDNTTLLTVRINLNVTHAVYVEHAFFGAVDQINLRFNTLIPKLAARRDASTQEVYLSRPPYRGAQLRMIGRDYVDSLGDTASTQAANTMQITAQTENLLFAKAARVLFSQQGMATGDIEEQFPQIQAAEAEFSEMAEDLKTTSPGQGWLYVG